MTRNINNFINIQEMNFLFSHLSCMNVFFSLVQKWTNKCFLFAIVYLHILYCMIEYSTLKIIMKGCMLNSNDKRICNRFLQKKKKMFLLFKSVPITNFKKIPLQIKFSAILYKYQFIYLLFSNTKFCIKSIK